MEISAEKTKLMTNNANGIQREIRVKGQKLETLTRFNYLANIVSGEGPKTLRFSQVLHRPLQLLKAVVNIER